MWRDISSCFCPLPALLTFSIGPLPAGGNSMPATSFRRFSTLFGIMELDIDWADPPASRKEQSTRGRFYAAE